MRLLTIAITFLMSSCLISAQVHDDMSEYFRRLHVQCEDAYMHNDFTLMRNTLDTRDSLLNAGLPEIISEEDRTEMLGMYHKDWGSYHYCIADIDGTGYAKALESYGKSLETFKGSSLKCAVIRTEIAQVLYGQKDYAKALEFLEDNFSYYSSKHYIHCR